MRTAFRLLGFALLLTGFGCRPANPGAASPAPHTPSAPRLKIVTTMDLLADLIRQVGGDRVQVTNIIPTGSGPEDYQPRPEDSRKIAESDVVFFNGHGLEDWLDDLFISAGKPNLHQVELSAGLPAVDIGGADFKQGNPHFWLSAANGMRYVEVIRDTLDRLDPDGKSMYDANAMAYLAQLKSLDDKLKSMASSLPPESRKLVTSHDAFPYFAQQYGFTIAGSILGSSEAEPSAGELADLVQRIRAEHVRAVFSEAQFSSRLSQTLADEAGVQVVANLYTDTLSEPGGEADSYARLLEFDMQTIVNALNGLKVQ